MKKLLFIIVAGLFSVTAAAQTMAVKGAVTSADNGNPIPGVSIQVMGTTTGATTDLNGNYSFATIDTSAVLVFSFVGFQTQKIKVNGKSVLNVVMVPQVATMDEVVVTSLGMSQQKALQGRVSGVVVHGYANFAPSATYTDESYSKISENGFKRTTDSPLSTFSIDVDRASWSNIRRFLNLGQNPPKDAVRIEEMVNYFNYSYPEPSGNHPYGITTEVAACPWQEGHLIMQIGLQAKHVSTENLPASNLVFLLDVSGSMNEPNKLPLVQSAFKLLVNNLRAKDRVAIVVYAGAAGEVLPSTSGENKVRIMDAIDQLRAGGSTAGGAGISLAYKIAQENFIKGGNNRIILATDGDFNVGASGDADMERLIEEKRKSGVFLTCLGFGMGNYKDSKMETLADKGNGNYAYIDNMQEANRMFTKEFGGTLFTVAKDVKLQVEFNPAVVEAYRLIGYENRLLNNEDFKDDAKDAGEMGSGHTVTAIYEIIPKGVKSPFVKEVDSLKYQAAKLTAEAKEGDEMATVKTRYKLPDGDTSIPFEVVVPFRKGKISSASESLRFSSAVAMFGMMLRNSAYKGDLTKDLIIKQAKLAKGSDEDGYRSEFIRLVEAYNAKVEVGED
ncbi:MAG TPA: von Willebrand factor type A domain-containing protein [Williamwhitmania sp.]|nr:von Willebrand factor type A domain-containing protein [Williamwhitmania sp.]